MPQCLQQPVPFIHLHLGSKHSPPTSISSGAPRYSKRCLNISRRYLNRANYDLIQRQHQEKVKPQPYSKAGHLTQKKILPATKTTPFPVLPTRSASVSCKVHIQSAEFCESFLERTVVRWKIHMRSSLLALSVILIALIHVSQDLYRIQLLEA